MKFLDLPKPHGFLIWRGKQTAIASISPLAVGEKMLIVSDGEPYGEAILSQPVAVNLKGFEQMEEYHCVRPEDRKLQWPNAESFFVHRLKSWTPYEEWQADGKRVLPLKSIKMLDNGECELCNLPQPTDEQKKLLEQAERLPKTVILLDEAVRLEDGKAIYSNGIDGSKLEPILKVTLDSIKSGEDSLPLYQLALVRIPRLTFKEKKSDMGGSMPYKKVMDHSGCDEDKPVGVINKDTDKLMGCSEDEEAADEHIAALMANEKDKGGRGSGRRPGGVSNRATRKTPKEAGTKELIEEARKCYDEGMPMPFTGPTSFADLYALEEARQVRNEIQELTFQFQMLSNNIFTSPDVEDKAVALSALAKEYGGLVKEAMTEGQKWVADETSREEAKAIELEMNAWVEEWKEWAVLA